MKDTILAIALIIFLWIMAKEAGVSNIPSTLFKGLILGLGFWILIIVLQFINKHKFRKQYDSDDERLDK
ncbi:MAG: hypothetical protein OXI88_05615 [Gammaproteobacteria bacterium]|nr:hypothetical protein [Gammaproteobacteria bacterium]MDE0511243.1 hypothetical protein [Gammaproteobacteria bacterium]